MFKNKIISMTENFQESMRENFIRLNITEKGFDRDKFSEYMKRCKGTSRLTEDNGENANQWNFEELKEAVINFTNKTKAESETSESVISEQSRDFAITNSGSFNSVLRLRVS
eukprot:TRINITY_DN10085_c0_g2_i9.p3 TRINITY_DN10085_c0_g2~~TRINITY_DN10085_c0_g2_i9.p3  ORF type:complete len:112 (+),score=27.25 TRINITY_DN10085_c0_g2_i9:36-371(+)